MYECLIFYNFRSLMIQKIAYHLADFTPRNLIIILLKKSKKKKAHVTNIDYGFYLKTSFNLLF